MSYQMLQESINDAISAASEVAWSISIRDGIGYECAGCSATTSMQTASIGKLLLLTEIARQCNAGSLNGDELLLRDPTLMVADSGIWQYMQAEKLSVYDLCVLVACTSDNFATNVLLKRVGLPKVQELSRLLGFERTALLDYVRDSRGPDDVWTLSTGSAAELSSLMSSIARRGLISQPVSEQLDAWLAAGMDLSMVASAFGFDPLAHTTADRGFFIRNKTGTDAGVRADVGTIGRENVWFAYAVIANWDPAYPGLRDAVLSGMNAIGCALRSVLESDCQ